MLELLAEIKVMQGAAYLFQPMQNSRRFLMVFGKGGTPLQFAGSLLRAR
jgi:hypothetical protein